MDWLASLFRVLLDALFAKTGKTLLKLLTGGRAEIAPSFFRTAEYRPFSIYRSGKVWLVGEVYVFLIGALFWFVLIAISIGLANAA